MRLASAAGSNKRLPVAGSTSSTSGKSLPSLAAHQATGLVGPQSLATGGRKYDRHLKTVDDSGYQQFDAADTWHKIQGPSSSSSLVDSDEHRKQSHCEIEKRRRDKMNHYIMELASVIPSFTNNQSKFDKLTILRMAVQHVKSLRSSLCSFSSFHLRPSFLSSGNLLKNLILQMASQDARDNLFMVVTCDRAKVLFVSESSRDILNQEQHELVGQCLFDFLHKDDVSKVKEQILHFNTVPREMLVDSKTLQPIKLNHQQRHQSFSQMKGNSNSTPQPGARRSFFCRMRSGSANQAQAGVLPATDSPSIIKTPAATVRSNQTHSTGCSSESATTTTTTTTSTSRKRHQQQEDSDNQTHSSGNSSSTSSSDMNNKNESSSGIGSSEGATSSSGEQSIGSTGSGIHLAKKLAHHSNYRSHKRKNWRYIVMHCTGYLKPITLKNDEFDDDDYESLNSDNNQSDEDESYSWRTINCLVVVCRRSPFDRDLKPDRPLTFTCRYSMDGKFTFVDQRTTMALGYTPQQLLGTSHYAYCHKDSVNTFKECHRQSILKSEPVSSDIYQFKRANGQNLWLQTSLKSFRNPWTTFIDYIIASHTTAEGNEPLYNEGCVPTKFNRDISGDGSQSSSPSSSLSLTSTDGKKSTVSNYSSSMASSYSLESYSSGGNIQALLNRIDRVKPNKATTPLANENAKKKNKSNNNNNSSDDNNQLTSSSSSSSTRKSRDDTGNYSDLQSCSSLSSQTSSGEFALNRNSSLNCFRVVQSGGEQTNVSDQVSSMVTSIDANPTVDPVPSMNQMVYDQNNQKLDVFPYNVQEMSLTIPPPPTSQPTPCHQIIQVAVTQQQQLQSTSMQQVAATCRQTIGGKLQSPYTIPSVVPNCPVTVVPASQNQQQRIQPPASRIVSPQQLITGDRYGQEIVPSNPYPVDSNVNSLYKVAVSPPSQRRMQDQSMAAVNSIPVHPQHLIQAQRSLIDVPQMMWNPNAPIVQQQQPANSETSQAYHQAMGVPQQQMCQQVVSNSSLHSLGSLDETGLAQHVIQAPPQQQQQQQIQCQQCANHKCSVQPPVIIGNSTDLSDITSLAVDEELDEEQLLEYLAGCDSGTQLYYTQNNAFP